MMIRRMDLKKAIAFTSLLLLVLIFTSFAGIIGFRNPKVAKSSAVSGVKKDVKPVLYEDFEGGALEGSYAYANTEGGASAQYMISAAGEDKAHNGQYCAKAVYDTGSNSDWGCGFGSNTTKGPGFLDATDRTKISLWVNAKEGISFYIFINESGLNGGDGEFYNSPAQTGAGKWQEVEIPFDEFFRNIYSGNQAGNLEFDEHAIGVIGGQIGGNQGRGKLLIDDIWIK